MKLKFKRLTDTAKIPEYAHDGDSGMDICADETVSIVPGNLKLQLVLAPVCHADIEETNDLGCMTERGTNGFGSSGRF